MKPLAERLASSRQEDLYEERAAIMEFDGHMTRAEAEVKARTDIGMVKP